MRHSRLFSATLAASLVVLLQFVPATAGANDDDQLIRTQIIELKNTLQQQPDNLEARMALAELYLEQQAGAGAEKELQVILTYLPPEAEERPGIQLKLLRAFWQQRDNEQVAKYQLPLMALTAEQQAEAAVLQGQAFLALSPPLPNEAKRAFLLASHLGADSVNGDLAEYLALKQDNDPGAADKLTRLSRDYPEHGDIQEMYAEQLFAQGKLMQAARKFTKLSQRYPMAERLYIARITALLGLGDYDLAQQLLNPLLADESNLQARYLQSELLMQRGEYKQASELLGQMLADVPEHAPSRLLSATAYLQQGMLEAAQGEAKEYLKRVPEDPAGLRILVAIKLARGESEDAVSLMQNRQIFTAGDHSLLMGLSHQALLKGDQAQAEELLAQANELASEVELQSVEQAQLAELNLNVGMTDEGVSWLEQAQQLDIGDHRIAYRLFSAYLMAGNMPQAAMLAKQYREAYPARATGFVMQAMWAMQSQDNHQAEAQLEQALNIEPGFPLAAHYLAQLLYSNDNVERARQIYASVLDHYPGHALTGRALFLLEAEQEQPKQGLNWLKKVYQQAPGDRQAQRFYAQGLLASPDQGHNDYGEKLLVKLAENQPQTVDLVTLAEYKQLQGDYKAALEHIERAMVLTTGYKEQHNKLALRKGELLYKLQSYQQAERLSEQYLKQDPNNQASWLWLAGQSAIKKQRWRAARRHLQALLQQQPRSMVLYNLVQVLFSQRDFTAAETQLSQWVEKNPDDHRALEALALCYISLEQPAKAKESYLALNKLRPNNPVTLNNLAWLSMQFGELEQSRQFAEKALALAPDSESVQDTLREIKARQAAGRK